VELRLESTGDLESKDLSSIPTSTTWWNLFPLQGLNFFTDKMSGLS
jgi:hypothetical protein